MTKLDRDLSVTQDSDMLGTHKIRTYVMVAVLY